VAKGGCVERCLVAPFFKPPAATWFISTPDWHKNFGVSDPILKNPHQLRVVDVIKVTFDIQVQNPSLVPASGWIKLRVRTLNRVVTATIWTESEGIVAEVRLIDRFQYHPERLLYNPVLDGRYPERAYLIGALRCESKRLARLIPSDTLEAVSNPSFPNRSYGFLRKSALYEVSIEAHRPHVSAMAYHVPIQERTLPSSPI
ncbi:hypothetical protein, partial [Salinibacter ruber]|uniref:hypothetical protein n=1 Tax=Salinibacter ruber TaxID=146919 RepID=UPI00243412EC